MQRWPGIVLFLAIFGVAIAVIALEAVKTKNSATTNQAQYELASQNSRKIQDGLNSSDDIISDDGQVGNPKVYPDMGCELPNYLSKNGQIIAQAANGTEVAVAIKGVNWFGMETYVACE
jgi:endoglucanase